MATQLNTTDLDFDKIKDNLKTYLKNSGGAFADYDYEGSGLNSLLDILAYNTHYNAVNAHMAVNESFIDTAQVRANVVSHAKLIGYIPRSVRAPSAKENLPDFPSPPCPPLPFTSDPAPPPAPAVTVIVTFVASSGISTVLITSVPPT